MSKVPPKSNISSSSPPSRNLRPRTANLIAGLELSLDPETFGKSLILGSSPSYLLHPVTPAVVAPSALSLATSAMLPPHTSFPWMIPANWPSAASSESPALSSAAAFDYHNSMVYPQYEPPSASAPSMASQSFPWMIPVNWPTTASSEPSALSSAVAFYHHNSMVYQQYEPPSASAPSMASQSFPWMIPANWPPTASSEPPTLSSTDAFYYHNSMVYQQYDPPSASAPSMASQSFPWMIPANWPPAASSVPPAFCSAAAFYQYEPLSASAPSMASLYHNSMVYQQYEPPSASAPSMASQSFPWMIPANWPPTANSEPPALSSTDAFYYHNSMVYQQYDPPSASAPSMASQSFPRMIPANWPPVASSEPPALSSAAAFYQYEPPSASAPSMASQSFPWMIPANLPPAASSEPPALSSTDAFYQYEPPSSSAPSMASQPPAARVYPQLQPQAASVYPQLQPPAAPYSAPQLTHWFSPILEPGSMNVYSYIMSVDRPTNVPIIMAGVCSLIARFSFCWKKLYTVIVYYGGHFVHIPVFSYTTNTSKIYENVDLEELSVPELKVCVGDILGEFDSLYYIFHTGIRLFTSTNKDKLVELSKQCDYTATFYVYHQTPTDWDDDIDNFRDDGTYSDEEYNEIRKTTKEDRLRMEEFEKEYETNNGSESESYTSDCSASYDDFSSEEESDREVCYATPSKFKKGKKVEEIFNAKTAARDIKWKVGLVFANNIEFKEAIRYNSMETDHKVNKCHTKPEGYVAPKPQKKIGRPKKTMAPDVEHEVRVEEELQNKEATTGEAEMMDELLNQMVHEHEEEIPRLDDDVETVEVMPPKVPKKVASKAIEFMPTLGIRNLRAHVTGSTPPASTPPTATSQKQNKGNQPSTQQSTSHRPLTRSVG
ncbi:hypothetical protein POM88_021187 [Heracleum sosnowskyi]|uniref:Uncharacterized protein n=1 Tax=Heracleum sosnowskyi TaxID=360622 RepID=A0AAD8ICR6_9APIA|nr:hypothetical protein POM88_021187 [Heracleum sosnowskyi]